ncbi:type I restriction-modification system subunit M [Pseudarthrobacter siccitolerans]
MNSIVQIAEKFHSKAEAWDLKAYVLGALFYRFLSDDLVSYFNHQERAAGVASFDYTTLDDTQARIARSETIEEKGYFLLPSQLFGTVQLNAGEDESLNETLNDVFTAISESATGTASEHAFEGLFSNFNPNSEGLGDTVGKRNERLTKLLTSIAGHPMTDAAKDFDELLRYYVTTAGKKGGDHFTPPTIAQLVAQLATAANPRGRTVYDPAFGSGSLLIKTRTCLANNGKLYGQELVQTNYNMARMNLLLHGIGFDEFNLAGGESTLTKPMHDEDEPFDIIVSNPKWSAPWPGDEDGLLINDDRFAPAGILAPKQYHDLAFTMHAASWLASNGAAVLVQFPGTLYRGKAEAKIREYLVRNNLVDTVIQLPPDWGYGVTVPGVIVILRKAKSDNAVLFIDASSLFKRVGNKNELLDVHQKRIVEVFADRTDVDHFSRLVPNEDIVLEQYNLGVSKYVQPTSDHAAIDIRALNTDIAAIVRRQTVLRAEIDRVIADLEGGQA